MAMAINVNGEARVRTGTGAASALEDLGVSQDGVSIGIRDHTSPVFTDSFGGPLGPPFDEQQFQQDAIIRMLLPFYDEAVLTKIRSRMGGTDGVQAASGALWGGGAKYFRLLVTSPVGALPWNFLTARLYESFEHKIGTKYTIWDLTFYAVPYTGVAGVTSANVLWNRTTS